jgi:hypothetical protein
MLTFIMLARLATLCPAPVLQRVDRLIEPLRATCTAKVSPCAAPGHLLCSLSLVSRCFTVHHECTAVVGEPLLSPYMALGHASVLTVATWEQRLTGEVIHHSQLQTQLLFFFFMK